MYAKLFERGGGGVQSAYGYIPKLGGGGGGGCAVGKLNEQIRHSQRMWGGKHSDLYI